MIWIAAFWLVNSLHAQSRSSLEKKRKKAESDLAANRKILKTTQKEKKATLYRLNALNQIIVQSEQLLRNLQEEVQVLDLETQNKQKELDRLQFAYEKERVKLKTSPEIIIRIEPRFNKTYASKSKRQKQKFRLFRSQNNPKKSVK